MQPNQQQQEAAYRLVRMLDLAPPGKEETLQPDFTPNPVQGRFCHYPELKSKNQDAAVPPDETLKKITEPDPEILFQNKSIIDDFRRCFELKENPKLKKSTTRLVKEKPSGLDEEREDFGNGSDAQPMDAIEYKSKIKVEKTGDSNPVQDFEAMMSGRDSPEWVSKAIQCMKDKIFELV